MAGAVALRHGKPANAESPTKIGTVDKGPKVLPFNRPQSFMERQTPHQSRLKDKGVNPNVAWRMESPTK
jgi:hypothetical protein